MVRALKVCSTVDCHELVVTGRCAECRRKAEQARGTAAQRGYGHRWSTKTRTAYLARHPLCVVRGPRCTLLAEIPDHYPTSRRDLVAAGVHDPDADHRLRPVCRRCHSAETAVNQPGGWHRPAS
jgi:5-methylcytosine-specific restriction protein A